MSDILMGLLTALVGGTILIFHKRRLEAWHDKRPILSHLLIAALLGVVMAAIVLLPRLGSVEVIPHPVRVPIPRFRFVGTPPRGQLTMLMPTLALTALAILEASWLDGVDRARYMRSRTILEGDGARARGDEPYYRRLTSAMRPISFVMVITLVVALGKLFASLSRLGSPPYVAEHLARARGSAFVLVAVAICYPLITRILMNLPGGKLQPRWPSFAGDLWRRILVAAVSEKQVVQTHRFFFAGVLACSLLTAAIHV